MRVISGTAGGIILKAVSGTQTRPTADKVKEAIFSKIGPYFQGGTTLDLFAGTGSLGIEALSRGMDKGIFIDHHRKSVEVILHNLHVTKLASQAEVYRNDSMRALKILAKRHHKFNLVFLDPPYDLHNVGEVMRYLDEYDLLWHDAIIVVEHDKTLTFTDRIGDLHWMDSTTYGDTTITIYKNMNAKKEVEST